jgi:LmbE family N-acetylglucosaminyl deacetylase
MTSAQLPVLPPDTFQRVLCVVAHPDDVEYGTAAAVAAWTAAGAEVAYLMLTRGEAGMDGMDPAETGVLRTREQIAAGAAVGVSTVDFLDHRDGVLEYGLDLRRDVSRAIRRFRPDAVVTGTWEVEFPAGLNQADHRVAGMVVLDAVRDAGNRWVFPELLDEGLEPHSPRWLLVSGHSVPTHGVDVTGQAFERGVAALEAHREYLAMIPGHPPAREILTIIGGLQGKAVGTAQAVLFRAWDFQAPPAMFAEAADST